MVVVLVALGDEVCRFPFLVLLLLPFSPADAAVGLVQAALVNIHQPEGGCSGHFSFLATCMHIF